MVQFQLVDFFIGVHFSYSHNFNSCDELDYLTHGFVTCSKLSELFQFT